MSCSLGASIALSAVVQSVELNVRAVGCFSEPALLLVTLENIADAVSVIDEMVRNSWMDLKYTDPQF
ncbi:hypothetical protein AWN88_21615 [Agrobacterium tumefaciens]|nr:hypothetical protein AWN88_21615 [Agrobacterium tumefaciens]KAJ37083.1 hypothetical protein BW45_09710 [Agrobacterium tumefaciens]